MNSKKKFFVASLLSTSLLGVGAASAFVIAGGSGSSTGTVDNVVYLDWGEGSTLADISSLTDNTPIYQEVALNAPNASSGASFTATLSIRMQVTEGEKNSLAGVIIEVANQAWGQETEAIATVDVDHPYSVAITEAKTLYLKYSVSASEYAKYVDGSQVMAGTATYSYTAEEVQG